MGLMKSSGISQFLPPEERESSYRVSLSMKFSIAVILLILFVLFSTTLFFIKKQKDLLYQEKMDTGEMVLNHFAYQAVHPLLENDILGLNTLIKEGKEVKGLLYVVMVDNKQVIKAHTDPLKIGLKFIDLENGETLTKDENTVFTTYPLSSGARVLNLSKPILFMNKNIGSVHLGFSFDLIHEEIKRKISPLLRNLLLFDLIVFIIGMATVLFFYGRSKRPISKMMGSEREIEKREIISSLDKVSTSKTARDQVTILYAGIKELSSYSNIKEPEKILEDINECLSIVTFHILEYGGYLAKIIGDTVIGVFRSSPLETNHTVRAVKSAVAIQKALENAISKNKNQLLGKVGIGISSGVVLSGPIGSRADKKYDFIGEIFKATQSLYVMAGPGEIIMSKDAYQAVENLVSVDPIPPREMVQRTEAWENFRLRNVLEEKKDG
jgi:adenylate cyclase